MVIVEYCKYGNLSNYLRAKREFFLPYRVGINLCPGAVSCFSVHYGGFDPRDLVIQDRSPKTQSQDRKSVV